MKTKRAQVVMLVMAHSFRNAYDEQNRTTLNVLNTIFFKLKIHFLLNFNEKITLLNIQ